VSDGDLDPDRDPDPDLDLDRHLDPEPAPVTLTPPARLALAVLAGLATVAAAVAVSCALGPQPISLRAALSGAEPDASILLGLRLPRAVLAALVGERVVGFAALAPASDPDTVPRLDAELLALCVDPAETGSSRAEAARSTADQVPGAATVFGQSSQASASRSTTGPPSSVHASNAVASSSTSTWTHSPGTHGCGAVGSPPR